MVTARRIRTRATANGGAIDSLASIQQSLNDSGDWKANTTTSITVDGNGVTITKTNGVTTTITNKDSAGSTAATKPPPKPAPKRGKTKKDVTSDPRLSQFIERSKYEAFRDPYRGISPFFFITHGNENKDELTIGQSVFIDSEHPATIHSINGQTATVEYSTRIFQDVKTSRISPMPNRKTRSGRINTVDNRRHTEMALDDTPSPWMKCANTLSTEWDYTHPQQVINLDTDDEVEKGITLVKCSCCSINEWSQSEYDAVEKERLAALKKKKKRGRKKKKEVVVVDGSDEECQDGDRVDGGEEVKDEVICGRRGGEECACDYNPFCLASLGGILDEYRYNIAKTKQMLSSSDSKLTDEEFATTMIKNWTEMPIRKSKQSTKQAGTSEKNQIRSYVMGSRAYVQTHLLTYICTDQSELSADRCMEMILNHHNSLIIPSAQMHLLKSNNNIQLSKPPGLKNLGATCYLNSQLQCLAQNLGFMTGLLSWKPTLPDTSDERSINSAKRMNDVLSSMQSILARMRYGHESIICTNEFALALGLENDEMQDPNEFAGLLFDRMQDSFKQCATISDQTELDNLLPSIYWGKSSITTTCSKCNYASKRIDDFKFLAIPIIDCDDESRKSRAKGISNDVDVQQLLDLSMHPESMDGDNQYFCSGCNKKCDAMRCPSFESLPPVLNLQLNRYVFNMESYSKEKLTTKVLLPHLLKVPLEGEETKTYVLVAVQNHLGNSAHGGHYVANVMDWSTGVWFEFNDEDVDVLDDGPLSGFHPDGTNDNDEDDTRRKISGSADAYNLLYVEKDYLSATTQSDLRRCEKGDNAVAIASADSSIIHVDLDVYQLHSRMRLDRFQLEQEEQIKEERKQKRLDFRKKQIISQLFSRGLKSSIFDSSNNSGDKMLVDSKVLKRFFSCTDGMEDLFDGTTQAFLDNKSLLCEHGTGVHPTTSAKMKLLSNELYGIFEKIVTDEYEMFKANDSSNNTTQSFSFNNLVLRDGDGTDMIVCKVCSTAHQVELKRTFTMLELLLEIHDDLHSESNDLGIVQDDSVDACAISRRFVTSFHKYVDNISKLLFNAKTTAEHNMPPGGDLHCLDFSELLDGDKSDDEETTAKEATDESLDTRVNSRITCEHGSCNIMYNQRSTRIIPKSLWIKIVEIFPKAIMHEYQPPSDGCIGNCKECFIEKESEDRFPIQIKEWKANIDNDPMLMSIVESSYSPGASTENLRILHRDKVQGWRDAFSYLLRSKKNVSNQTVREKLLQLCSSPSSMLICKEHQKTIGVPTLSQDKKSTISSLKEYNLELFCDDACSALLDSISALADILGETNCSSETPPHNKPPKAFLMKDGGEDDPLVLYYVEPEICDKGCVFAVNKSSEKDQVEIHSIVIDEDDAKPSEQEEDESIALCIHEVEGHNDLEVAASMILADLSSESSADPTQQRRSRRKKKGPGDFPCQSLKVPQDCNLAHLRLLVHEKTGKKLLRQCLHLVTDDQGGVLELSEKDNSKDFKDFVSDQANKDFHLLMTYKDAIISDESNGVSAGTRKRAPKVDVEQEENIMTALTQIAFQGMKSDNYDIGKGRKTKKRREERGFRGTFLQSSPSPDVPDSVQGEVSDGAECSKSIVPMDVTA